MCSLCMALCTALLFSCALYLIGCSSLMTGSSAKPLQGPSTGVPYIPAQGADSIMDGGNLWSNFQRLKVFLKRSRENAWRLRRLHEQTIFRRERNHRVPCSKTTKFRSLCAINKSPLSFRKRNQLGFSQRSQVPSHTSLCQHRSFSPSSAEDAVPI